MCSTLADVGATADGISPAPLPQVNTPEKDTTANTPTVWTTGLKVRPMEVTDKYAATAAKIHDQTDLEEDADGEEGEADKDESNATNRTRGGESRR